MRDSFSLVVEKKNDSRRVDRTPPWYGTCGMNRRKEIVCSYYHEDDTTITINETMESSLSVNGKSILCESRETDDPRTSAAEGPR
mmetsp:Transcript_19967/g.37863  ORF Transcript_19967/g.37863 Transcript_19967/m.37863 type:complete len:85 (+) Transcript_19967:1780-2034(+)